MVEIKSTTTDIFFNHQKIDYGDVFSIFLTFHRFIFSVHHVCFLFRLQLKVKKDMHLRFSLHLSIFVVDIWFFGFFNLTVIFLEFVYKDLIFFLFILFFRYINGWNEEYNHRRLFFPPKIRLWRCFFYFSYISSFHLLLFIMFVLFSGFNSRLKRHAPEISRSSVHFCCGYLIFLDFQPNWYFSSIFLQRSNVFFLFILFFSYINGWNQEYNHRHLRFPVHLSIFVVHVLTFWFLNLTGIFVYVSFKYLLVLCLILFFSV